MDYVKVNNKRYRIKSVDGLMSDRDWDGRESKTIHFLPNEISYESCLNEFVDGVNWSIMQEVTSTDEFGEEVQSVEEYSNDEFILAGEIIDHRDGSFSVKMGKLSDIEQIIDVIYGGHV